MAAINIPEGLLSDSELRQLQGAVNEAVREKKRTGSMNFERFMSIIKSVCRWLWDKICDIISDIWDGITSIF